MWNMGVMEMSSMPTHSSKLTMVNFMAGRVTQCQKPRPVRRGLFPVGDALLPGKAAPVEAVAQEAEQRGQQGHGGGGDGQDDDDGAHGQALVHVAGDNEDAPVGDDDDESGVEDGMAGSAARLGDGVDLVAPLLAFLSVAVGDEEGVVDA